MEALIPLIATAGLSGGFLYASKKNKDARENFQDVINPSVAKAFGPRQSQFIRDTNSRFNPLMNLINPSTNPLYGSPSEIQNNQQKVQNTAKAPLAYPNKTGYRLNPSNENTLRINTGGGAPGFEAVRICEKIKTDNCDAFDNKDFSNNCGICLEEGRNSLGNPSVGGLFIANMDKEDAELATKRMSSRNTNFYPSVGQCKLGRFATSKTQCKQIKKQMECLRKQSFEQEGCSQCFQDETFQYISTDLDTTSPSIILTGEGNLSAKHLRTNKEIKSRLDSGKVANLNFEDLNEGDTILIQIEPQGDENVSVAGFLEGTTASGKFTLDLLRLIQQDQETGGKPRMTGFTEMNGISLTVMRPQKGKNIMRLILFNPFTFIEPYEVEATSCSASPYITKSTSADFLNSGPCYKKGSGPGKYSLECLQNTFVNAGCDTNGLGYPDSDQKAQELMNQGGKQLNIAQIAGNIYDISNIAYAGRKNGAKLSINDWNNASMYCYGKPINSPCDADDKSNGPLSADCLDYIYQNKGAFDKKPGSLGPTYTNPDRSTSLLGNNTRYCSNKGSYSPFLENGEPNNVVITAAKNWGGVNAVKQLFNTIHQRANDNNLSDKDRKEAITQCYGVDLAQDASVGAISTRKDTSGWQSTIDDRMGRQQTPATRMNFDRAELSQLKRPVSVLAVYGGGPWGRWWAPGFPDDGTAKWIWANPNAISNEPSWQYYSFMKIYTNTTNNPINARLTVAIDNYGGVRVNDKVILWPIGGLAAANITLLPGDNKIVILGQNHGGPAGAIAIAKAGAQTLFVTDSSWLTA